MDSEMTPLEQRLEQLMAIRTTHDNPGAFMVLITQLEAELQNWGLQTERFGETYPMVLATTQGTRRPKVLLLIHLDVVPESGGAVCAMRIEGDKIYGRGVYDMKFAAACALELIQRLADEKRLKQYNFGVLFTTDEEVGGFELEKVLRDQGLAPGLTVIPDGGEGWTIEEAAKGLLHGTITTYGRTSHGSRPWEGENALDTLLKITQTLKTFHQDDKNGLTVSLNQIQAGKAINQIPDEASLRFDARSFVYEDLKTIDETCRALAEQYPMTYTCDVFGYPCLLNEHHDVTRDFIMLMSEFLGKPVTFSRSFAATDGRWFAEYNLPTITLRPRGGNIHGPEEWVQREDLPRFTELLYRFIVQATEVAR